VKRRRRNFILSSAALVALSTTRSWGATNQRALEFGVFPYLSARALLASYAPLKRFLEVQLRQTVQFSTAPNLRSFNERTLRGDYDLVMTPPHLARLAQLRSGYVPTNVYTRPLRAIFAVAKHSAIVDVQQLRGKVVVVPDRLAMVTFMAVHFLREQGLQPNIDYTLRISTSHTSAAYAVANGEGDVVITEVAVLEKSLPAEVRERLRSMLAVGRLPYVMFLAHPRLGLEKIDRLREAFVAFANDAVEGRTFIEATGFEGIRAATEADMQAVDPYMPALNALLEGVS
jgi:phosphonate transport system substrate-binding protein